MRLLTRPAILFAAAAAGGAAVGSGRDAKAQCTLCLPALRINNLEATSFLYLGSQTYGWDASIPVDNLYGFKVDSGPHGYAEFKTATWASGTRTVWATICRISWTGTAVNCTGSSQNQYTVSSNTQYDRLIDATGAYSTSFSKWDFWKVNLKGNQATGVISNKPNINIVSGPATDSW
jgi:hypothetical protein